MRAALTSILSATLVCIVPAQAGAQTALPTSWGKPDVTFLNYRTDAVDCAVIGHNSDVSGTEEAMIFADASGRLDRILDNNNSGSVSTNTTGTSAGADPMAGTQNALYAARLVESVRAEEKIASLKKTMETTVESCLRERGYQQFRLTQPQADYLGQLKPGSVERHVYLHSLASNPTVLDQQRI